MVNHVKNVKKHRGLWWKIPLAVIVTLVLIVLGYLLYVIMSYNRIEDQQPLIVEGTATQKFLSTEQAYTAVTYNIGFGAYTPDFTFFMDGGTQSWANSKESVEHCIRSDVELLKAQQADFLLLQEVDFDSTRSYHVNQAESFRQSFHTMCSTLAVNYHSPFLFYPLYQPHGASNAGLLTLSDVQITSGMRYSLPIAESFSKYLDQGNEARIKAVYENRDPRLQQTYITPYSEYLGSPSGKEITYTLRWPFIQNDTSNPFDLRSDSSTYFHYLVRKFVSEGNELIYRQYSPIDVPIIRYADVLLSLAEALNEQGKTSEAITYVNMVRERAGVAPLNSNEYTQVAGQDDMRNRIRREKRWELACEGTLYFDELRWGTWYDSKLFEGAGLKQCWGEASVSWTKNGDYYTKWPIPATERQLNTALTQNEGWID